MFDLQAPGPDFVLAAGKARQRGLLQEAERGKLMRRVKTARPGWLDCILAGIGGALISIGTKLQGPRFHQASYRAARDTSPRRG
jgi:hypothetical protein